MKLRILSLRAASLLMTLLPISTVLAQTAPPAASPATPAPETIIAPSPATVYRNQVVDIISTHWQELASPRVKSLPKGDTSVHIYVTAAGKVKSVTVVSSDHKILTELARQAIMEAKLPPIPKEAQSAMRDGTLEVMGFFSVYPPPATPVTDGGD